MFRIVPQLVVQDIPLSVAFYTSQLGFTVNVSDPPDKPEFVSLEREDASLFLVSEVSRDDEDLLAALKSGTRGAGVCLYFEVDDAEALYKEMMEHGVHILRELARNEEEDYTEFAVEDPDGYHIGIYS